MTEPLLMINPRPLSDLSLFSEEVIVKICENLTLYEQLVIGSMDINYQWIIGHHIISKGVLDISSISEHYDVRNAFKQFGPFATTLKIAENDIQYKEDELTNIEEIFRLVNKRCSVGKLKSIEIYFNGDAEEPCSISTIPDVIKEIESLCVNVKSSKRGTSFDRLLEQLLPSCRNLRSFEVSNMQGPGTYISLLPSNQLHSVSLKTCDFSFENWAKFIYHGRFQALKSLELNNSRLRDENGFHSCLVIKQESFPNLEQIKFSSPGALLLFERFSKLRDVYLNGGGIEQTIFNDCIEPSRQTLERLSFSFIDVTPISINSLTSLRFLEIFDMNIETKLFIPVFLQLPKLEELSIGNSDYVFGAESELFFIKSIVALSPRLKILKIKSKDKMTFAQYKQLAALSSVALPDAPPLHLHVRTGSFKTKKPCIVLHKLP